MKGTDFVGIAGDVFQSWGYFLIFITSFVESSPFGWITPGGAVLAGGGFFSKAGKLSFELVILNGFIGTWLMLLTGYLTGRRSGMFIARKLHQEKRAERAKQIFSKHGGVILTTSLTSNVTRFWISYVAGMKKVNFGKFCFYSSVASVTWVAVWSTAGYVVGGERYNLEKMIVRLGVFSWVLLLVALGTIFWSSRKEYEDTGN